MIDDLRVHASGESRPVARGDHVLYWMQSSLRAEDNHALTFAVEQANRLRLPLFVYHGLTDDYPWASDRLHTFILESAADLHDQFAEAMQPVEGWIGDRQLQKRGYRRCRVA